MHLEWRTLACHSERQRRICMDSPHRHPERVTTSYPIAICFSVSGGCHTHRCRDTMCCPSPSDDVGSPYILRFAQDLPPRRHINQAPLVILALPPLSF